MNFEKYEDLEGKLRPDEYKQSEIDIGEEVIKMAVSVKFWSVRTAICSACKTVFVCIVLTFVKIYCL